MHKASREAGIRNGHTKQLTSWTGSPELVRRHLGNSFIQRACKCGGTCATFSGPDVDTRHVQPKLTVGPADDPYEREADRVADEVMRMPEGITPPSTIQLMSIDRSKDRGEADISLPKEGGRPLSPATRSFMEPRFGAGFQHVRMHTDEQARQTAARLHARAFTFGQHIWLGDGETEENRRLMAHELTHVVQQQGEQGTWPASNAPSTASATKVSGPRGATSNPVATIQRLPFGIRLPSGVRALDPVEERIGRGVYGSSLDYGDIYISDALGGGERPFTLYLRFIGTIIQMGPGPYATPGSNPGLLIHEMAHSWQSQHHFDAAAFMANSIASQAAAAAAGGGASAYCYVPGKPFGEYAAEQIAQQAENGVAATRSHMRSIAAGAVDPDLNLLVPRWEVRGAPGVRC